MIELKKQIMAFLHGKEISHKVYDQNHLEFVVKKQNLPSHCKALVDEGGRFVTMVGTDEREIDNYFGLYYVFAFDKWGCFVTLKTKIDDDDTTFPSVTPTLSACDWYEREVNDLLGLKPIEHPNLHSLILHDDWPENEFPLKKDYPVEKMQKAEESQQWFSTEYKGEGITKVPVGPIHAGIIEPGHFQFGVAGDVILHLDAQLFFKHRGLEKKSEGMSFEKGLFLAERICASCSLSHATAYAQALERMANVTIPTRAQYLRTIYLEMERLYNHIGDVGDICSGAGFHLGTSHGARLKEELQQLNEQITGHRFLRGIITLGGVRRDLAEHEFALIQSTIARVRRDFRELINILLEHEITLDRMATTGHLTKDIADRLEVVGPAGRASGRKIDIRKSHPYLVYDQVEFTRPFYTQGDVLARVHVRIDEVFESCSIIRQIIEKMERGPVQTEMKEISPYSIGIGWNESPLGENIHWLMIGPDQTIYRYRVRSAAYSNWPAVPTSVKGNIVPDFPIINKSFELCYACCDR